MGVIPVQSVAILHQSLLITTRFHAGLRGVIRRFLPSHGRGKWLKCVDSEVPGVIYGAETYLARN